MQAAFVQSSQEHHNAAMQFELLGTTINLWLVLILFAVGVVAAILNVLAGGGSMLTMPTLVLMGLPGPVANGTTRIGVLLQTWTAVVAFRKLNATDLRISLLLGLCAMPGALAGAMMGVRLAGSAFNLTLAALMVLVAYSMLHPIRTVKGSGDHPRLWVALPLIALVGVYAGFILAGSGLVIIAVLNRLAGWDLVRVNAHKVFIMGCCTIVSLVVYIFNGAYNLPLGIVLAAANTLGGWLGAHLAVKRGEKLVRPVVVVVLLVLAGKLVWDATQ